MTRQLLTGLRLLLVLTVVLGIKIIDLLVSLLPGL